MNLIVIYIPFPLYKLLIPVLYYFFKNILPPNFRRVILAIFIIATKNFEKKLHVAHKLVIKY